MKRSIIMLLVVALLAMMIPSFALAEETTPKITLSNAEYTEYLYYGWSEGYTVYMGTSFTVSDFTTESEYGTYDRYGYAFFTSSDNSVVRVDEDDWEFCSGNGTHSMPRISVWGEGTSKITVTLYTDSDKGEAIASAAMDVKVCKAATEKLELDPATIEMEEGTSQSIVSCVKVTPSYAFYGGNVKWSVSDSTIARVDKNGYVTAVKAGATTVTATAKDTATATAMATITVKEKTKKEETAPTLTFTGSAFTMKMNEGLYLDEYLMVENLAVDDSILWTSSDPQVATVDSDCGDVWPETPGTVTITARSRRFPTASASVTVTIAKEALTAISFSGVPETIKEGNDFRIWNYVNTDPTYYVSKYRSEIGWSSSDPQIAYVTDDGYLMGSKVGTATITAFSKLNEEVKAEFTIKVLSVPVTSAAFSKAEYTLKVGKSIDLMENRNITLQPRDYSNDHVISWMSSDEEVATVSGGMVYANKAGAATITMEIRNADDSIVTASTKVTVTENALTAVAFKKDAYTVKLSNDPDSKSIRLALTPADADFDEDDLYVDSSDPTIAEAYINDGTVYVHPRKPGTVTITVASHENAAITASTTVTVKPIALTSVELAKASVTVPLYTNTDLYYNETKIQANIKPSDAYCEATWETSDASVAFVRDTEKDGRSAKLVAAGIGTCQIVLTATDGTNTMTATMSVIVKPAKVTNLVLNKTKGTVFMIKGNDNTLELTASDGKTGADVPVTWTSSNKKIATVSKDGLVKFVKNGRVKITATTKDGTNTTATCTLNIKKLAVTLVKPAKKTMTMKVGDEKALKVTVKPAKAYNAAVSFKSSKPAIVSVDAEGNLKALKAGKAVITITAKDGSKKSAKVTIAVKAAAKNNAEEAIDQIPEIDGELTVEGDLLDDIDNLFLDDVVIEGVDGITEVVID